MPEEEATVVTEVTIPTEPEETTPVVEDEGDTTVVVTTESGGDAPVEAVIDHEGRLTRIEQTQEEILALLTATAQRAEEAQVTADVAVEMAVSPEPEPEPEPDQPPRKVNVMHRSWRELLGRG